MSALMWEGNWGVYAIPEEFRGVHMTKRGWPDRRYKASAAFLAWVKKTDVPK